MRQLVFLLIALIILAPLSARAQEPTGVPHEPGHPFLVERLIDDEPVMMDTFGRVPLLRVTFPPGAKLPTGLVPEGETNPVPFFLERLIVVVEAGEFSFDVDSGSITTTLGAGERIEIPAEAALTIENVDSEQGSLLVLRTSYDPMKYRSLDADLTRYAPEGIVFTQVFQRNSLEFKQLEVRLSLDRVTLESADELNSFDLGGATKPLSVSVRVESGTFRGSYGSIWMNLETGSVVSFSPFDAATTTRILANAPGSAVLLVVRVAER